MGGGVGVNIRANGSAAAGLSLRQLQPQLPPLVVADLAGWWCWAEGVYVQSHLGSDKRRCHLSNPQRVGAPRIGQRRAGRGAAWTPLVVLAPNQRHRPQHAVAKGSEDETMTFSTRDGSAPAVPCRDVAGRRRHLTVSTTVDGQVLLAFPPGECVVFEPLETGRLRSVLREALLNLDAARRASDLAPERTTV